MRRYVRAGLMFALVLALATLGGGGTPAYAWTAVDALNTNAASDSGYDGGSQVTTDGLGHWVAVWESNENLGGTIGTDWDILVSRSTNNGATWTAVAALNTNAAADSGTDDSPQVTTDGLGRWVAVWKSNDSLGGTIGEDNDILVSRSTDNGATWTAPVALNTNAATDSGYDTGPQVTSDGGSNWVAVWYSDDTLGGTIGTDFDILVSRSTDNGATWTAPAALNTNAAADSGTDDSPQVTTDGLGRWVAVWRSDDSLGDTIGTDWDILVSRSINNGASWTAPAALNTNAATDTGWDHEPQVTTDGLGHWVAVWKSNDSLGGTIGTDDDILVSRSTDNGATWTAPAPLNTNAATDAGHDGGPQVATDGLGGWVAVWESNDSLGGTIGTDGDILVSPSTDNGATWTAPAPLNTNAATDTGEDRYPQVTTDGLSRWAAAWRSNDSLGGTIGTDYDILYATEYTSPSAGRLSISLDTPTPLPLGHFGESVAVGDVNGDTYADIVVGALYEGGGACGRVHVFFGPNGSPVWTLDMPVPQADARFGQSVAVGDVNSDGKGDIVVGAPFEDVGLNNDQGRVYVFSGVNGSVLRTLDTPNPNSGWFGWSVAVGYVDAVAGGDIVVGAPAEGGGGKAYVFSGGLGGPLIHTLASPNPDVGGQFGHSVAVGDVNADYRADIAVGAHYEHVGGRADEGRAYVFCGVSGSLLRTLQMPTGQADAHLGWSVAVGYVNADQNADIAVGAPDEDVGDNPDQGRAYVFSGAGNSPPLPPLFILDSPNPRPNGHFGFPVAVDWVNNDQNADIAVGAYSEAALGVGPRAYVFSGDNGSLFRTLANPSSQTNNQFGASLAVGDVDNDLKINDGCPAVGPPETGVQCDDSVDHDGDTLVNDGCPAVGPPETGAQCNNALNDDVDDVADIALGAGAEAVGDNPDQGRAYVFSAEEPPPPATYYYDVTFEAASIIVGGEEKCVPSPCVLTGTAKVIRGNPYWSGGKQCADYHIESLTLTGTVGGVAVEIRVGEGLTVPGSSGTTCEGTGDFDVTLSLYIEEWEEGVGLASSGSTLAADDPKYCSCCIAPPDCGMEPGRWSSIGCTAVVSEDPPDQITYDCGEGYDLCDCGTDEEKVWVGTPQTGGLLFGPVGGIAEWPGAAADSDQSARSSSGSGFNYTALGGALAAAAVALAAGAWLARRRWAR
jgi:hypothetical protein